MKRIVIYIGILVLLTLTPVQGANIGRLHPVEVVLVDQINQTFMKLLRWTKLEIQLNI